MAGKFAIVLVAFLAVQGLSSATNIKEKIWDLISSDAEVNLSFIPEKIFDLLPENEPAVAGNPENCLPNIKEGYETAVEARKIVNKAKKLAKTLRDSLVKCKGLSNPGEKKACFQFLKMKVVAEAKPLRESYHQLRPKVTDVMSKFDKCMA